MDKREYEAVSFPRPIQERKNWMSLNGTWEFDFEENNTANPNKYRRKQLDKEIRVPFCYQSKDSGIHDLELHQQMRYRKTFELTKEQAQETVLLNFGAVDYEAYVWVNREYACFHKGGFTSFYADITAYINEGTNEIEVLAIDDCSRCKPRGKQIWEKEGRGCHYTPTSGIWRDVWLEFTGEKYIKQVKITPELDENRAVFDIETNTDRAPLEVAIRFKGKEVWKGTVTAPSRHARITADLGDKGIATFLHYWSPDFPNLYDVQIRLFDGGIVKDTVKTYFGMRKIHVEDGVVYLNNEPFYQRLVLAQGYWEDSLMTPPDSDAVRRDVEQIKQMGFNGIRMHQKIEDDRFYYWADKLGLVVWGEMPSAYEFNEQAMEATRHELSCFVNQAYNHPSIIVWVPLNESWGVRNILTSRQQQDYAAFLYYLVKAQDETRLVNTNDGWEQIGTTDLCGIHDYVVDPCKVTEKYRDMPAVLKGAVQGRKLFAQNHGYKGQPIILSEFGGMSLASSNGWGYQDKANGVDEYLDRLKKLIRGISSIPEIQGFCFTQFTDVIQETNGLLNEKRNPKADLEKIAAIITQR